MGMRMGRQLRRRTRLEERVFRIEVGMVVCPQLEKAEKVEEGVNITWDAVEDSTLACVVFIWPVVFSVIVHVL